MSTSLRIALAAASAVAYVTQRDATAMEPDATTPIIDHREDPPKRVSLDPGSPYYFTQYQALGVNFNGSVRNDVIEYDAEGGWIIVGLKNGQGKPIYERGVRRTIKLSGLVIPFWRT